MKPNITQRNTAVSQDPVLHRRSQIERISNLAYRLGFVIYGIATACLVYSFAANKDLGLLISVCLLGGSLLLAPAIVFRYGVKAAKRADREGSW